MVTNQTSGSEIRGVICALLTPLRDDGSLDADGIRSLLDFVTAGGVRAVMPGGTTGEGPLLTLEERKELLEIVAKHAPENIAVMAHVGCMDTASTLDLARHATDLGVTSVSAIAPYYYTFDPSSVEKHFAALAEAVPDTDVYTYTFPGNAKNEVLPALMRRLTKAYPNIKGVKISNSDLLNLRAHITAGSDTYRAYCGSDAIMLAALLEGAAGQVSGNANIAPNLMRALYNAFEVKDYLKASQYQKAIDSLRASTADGLHPAFYKSMLQKLGVIKSATVRSPLRQPQAKERDALTAALAQLKTLGLDPASA